MVSAKNEIQKPPENRQRQNWDEPGDFIGRVAPVVDNIENGADA